MYIYMYIYMYVCVCACVCVYIYVYIIQLTHKAKNGEQHYIYSRWTSGYAREELGPGK